MTRPDLRVDPPIIQWVDQHGTKRLEPLDQAIPDISGCRPVRRIPTQAKKGGIRTEYWCETTRAYLHCESQHEAAWAMLFDYARHVTDIRTQPFTLVDIGLPWRHTPDFLIVYDNAVLKWWTSRHQEDPMIPNLWPS